MRDFTVEMYGMLLSASKESYDVFTIRDYLLKKPEGGIILRHDVDVSASKALVMAKL